MRDRHSAGDSRCPAGRQDGPAIRVAARPAGAGIGGKPAILLALWIALAGAIQYSSQLKERLEPALDGAELWVRGTIASLPERGADHLRFLFRPSKLQAELAGLPSLIEVRWYRSEVEPQPGQAWRLKLRLRPSLGLVNFQGFDRERSLFARRIGALASVLESERLSRAEDASDSADRLRSEVRERIRSALPPGPGRALVLSLAIADRSELGSKTWGLLRATGTGHLLAISGLHIGLAAVVGFWLTRALLLLWPPIAGTGRAAFLAGCSGAALSALAYGALAGFPVSAERALAMLAAALLIIAGRRGSGLFQAWLLAVLCVLAIDPFAPLTAGFWLSFGAVAGLLVFFGPRGEGGRWWSVLPRAQVAVMAVTLPLAALWFQSGSWLAFPANLLAVPWVSLISVPLVLAAVATLALPSLSGPLLELAWWSCAILHEFLQTVASIDGGHRWLTPSAGIAAAALALGGGLLLLLPRGLAPRWMGGCLLAVLFLPRAASLQPGAYSVESLDVGQGQAVLVRTRNHTLLYDTGPGDGADWSLFDSVVAPALAADGGYAPEIVVVSHADLDHAGGLADLRVQFPEVDLRFNHAGEASQSCFEGQSWAWDGVTFRVLHPSRWLPYLGNDSSCVISIDNGAHRTLLSGDIEAAVEDRLLEGLEAHDLITVPHHGSTSSSSRAFVAAVRPSWAVVSAAHGNRFGFPRPEVVERYRRLDAAVLSTSDCGAVRALFPVSGVPQVEVARLARDRPWRWHGENACMATSDHPMYHLNRLESKR